MEKGLLFCSLGEIFWVINGLTWFELLIVTNK
jgi:hypothetical protein